MIPKKIIRYYRILFSFLLILALGTLFCTISLQSYRLAGIVSYTILVIMLLVLVVFPGLPNWQQSRFTEEDLPDGEYVVTRREQRNIPNSKIWTSIYYIEFNGAEYPFCLGKDILVVDVQKVKIKVKNGRIVDSNPLFK